MGRTGSPPAPDFQRETEAWQRSGRKGNPSLLVPPGGDKEERQEQVTVVTRGR